MGLAARITRHERQRRVMRALRERRVSTGATQDPGPLLDFVPRVTRAFRAPTHLATLAHAIERGQAAPGSVRATFSVPVRHGKTSLVHHGIAWLLAKDPWRSILYVSYAHGFAAKQAGKAKEIAIRAGVRTIGRRKDEWTTRAGGLVKAAGIGGQITGEGFTDVFVDDPHKNRAEAESRMIREGVVEAFFNDVFTRRDPRGTNFYVIHARWHPSDLIGVLTHLDSHPFEEHNAPALSDAGEPLAPWLFDVEQLEELRDTLGPYVWASLYQGRPRPRGGALFVEPTLARLSTPAEYRIAIGIDLARTARTRSDHNAAVVMRKDLARTTIDVLEATRVRGTLTDRVRGDELVDAGFVRELVRLLLVYPGAQLCMYALLLEEPLVRLLERILSSALGFDVAVQMLPIAGDKYLRAQPYAASWNAGRVRIPGRATVRDQDADADAPDEGRNRDGWQHAFVSEHVEFTGVRGEEDDQVDAGAAAHDWLMQDEGTSLAEAMRAAGRIR